MSTLPPDKQAIVQELARRYGVGGGDAPDPLLTGAPAAKPAAAPIPLALQPGHKDADSQIFGNPYDPNYHDIDPAKTVADFAKPGFDNKMQAVHNVVSSVADSAMHNPIALAAGGAVEGGAAALSSIVPRVAGLVGAIGAQKAVDSGANALGVSPGTSHVLGDVAGIAGGELGPKLLDSAAALIPKPSIETHLDPAEASSVAYGDREGVQMSTSTRTGSKVAANAENIAQNLPLMASVAKAARAKEQSTLAAAGAREVDQLGTPGSGAPVPTPLDAGEGLQQKTLANEKAHGVAADNSYSLLKSIESQPQHTANLPTGTERVPDGLDEDGNPAFKTVPKMEDVQLPVDYRGMKSAVKPLLEDQLRGMPQTQAESSTGIAVMKAIASSPDFVPASVADRDLGAMKGILRDSGQSTSVGQVKVAADLLSKQVDGAVARAGPDAVAALKQGRASTVAKYQEQSFQKALGFRDVGTNSVQPGSAVDMVNKLTAPGDRQINLLRQVAAQAPEHLPAIAQSVTQGLLDGVTAEAGMSKPQAALIAFNKLGPQTKATLFGNRTQSLSDFFTLAKRTAENPNASGSGSLLAMVKGVGMVVTSPITAVPYILGAKPLARMLFNPAESRLMMTAMKMPAKSGAAGDLLVKNILAAAGPDAVPAKPSGVSTSAETLPSSGNGPAGSGAANAPGVGAPAGAAEVLGGQGSGGGSVRSADTVVPVPGGAGAGYPARYSVKELADVNASHNGTTFQPNPKYALKNDRNYANAVNQGKIIDGASRSEFKPALHITDNADATNGPVITDAAGQVLGGNGRKMMLDRIYAGNPKGAADYRALLRSKADQFGIDPASVDALKQPILTREIPDSALGGPGAKQKAVTDFNKVGTGSLTPAERAIADSRQVSEGTLSDMASRLDAKGPDATIAQALEGKSGGAVLRKLIDDGVVSPQEQAAFLHGAGVKEGELTDAGKDRISQLVVGRFFKDPAQLDSIAPSVLAKVQRIAAPLAQVETKQGWNLTPDVQSALDLLDQARKVKANVDDFVKQDGLFGKDKWPEKAVTIAKAMQVSKSTEVTAAARQYAQDAAYADKGQSLMGDTPTPEQSFADSFGALKSGAQSDIAKLAALKKSKE